MQSGSKKSVFFVITLYGIFCTSFGNKPRAYRLEKVTHVDPVPKFGQSKNG